MKTLEAIKALVASKGARQILFAKHHSPKILFIAGTIGVVGTVVLACRATLKVNDILDNHENGVDHFSESGGTGSITHEEANTSIRNLKIKTGLEIAKLYALPIGLGAASIAALTGSHFILTKRNSAVMAAYMGLDQAYKQYRQRVADEYGADTDRKFISGVEDVKVIEKTADGGTKTITTQKNTGRYGGSPYAEVFDERSRFFSREPGRNAATINMKQNWANDKLRAQGHLYLNEVLDMLGLPRSLPGTVVGWVYRHDNEAKTGDNYVDFGVFCGETEWVEAFIDGDEKYCTLDFNVDGPISEILFGKNSR